MAIFELDTYVVDTLMRDFIAHEQQPSAFIVYLQLWRLKAGTRGRKVTASLQMLADHTGLSKSAVQQAVKRLKERALIRVTTAHATAVPTYEVLAPWRARGR